MAHALPSVRVNRKNSVRYACICDEKRLVLKSPRQVSLSTNRFCKSLLLSVAPVQLDESLAVRDRIEA